MPKMSQQALEEVGRRRGGLLDWMFNVRLEDPVDDYVPHEGQGT